MSVQIVTDSGSDLTPELAAAHGVTVVPLQVLIDGESYRDRVDLSPEAFYAKMQAARELPKTSQPTPHDMAVAYQTAAERGPVLGIHLSAALSGTWQTAVMAARGISESIQVFDSRTGSGGQALMVLAAAAMARAGAGIKEIWQRLETMRAETETLVALNTLENAVKGGRVKPLAGMAASLLGIKPIVQVTREGTVEPVDRVRGRKRSLDRLLEMAAERRSDWADRLVAVAHAGCPEEGDAFVQRVRERFRPREVLLLSMGATIGTYAAEEAILFSF